MKYYLLFLMLAFYTSKAQQVALPTEWKFKLGDNMQWTNQSFNDADWGNTQVGEKFSATGVKGNVYLWYRIKLIIPSGIKSGVEKENGLRINLGKIDDVDQTFFNGKLIGQTGSFPPTFNGKWDTKRMYIISANEVQWDKENTIAVRVFSPDAAGVGMYAGVYNYGPAQWTDYISARQAITKTSNNAFITKLIFTSTRNNSFNGKVKYRVADKNNKELFTEIKPVQMQLVNGAEAVVTFSNYQPLDEQGLQVGYMVTSDYGGDTLSSEKLYLPNKEIEIKVTDEPKLIVQNKVQALFTSIPFGNQQLQGYLGKRIIQNLEERLLKIDEAGLIDGYLQRPGKHPWIGEHVGKYLETACNTWKYSHDARLKKQMDRMMYQLINTQLADGYLGTYTPNEYWTSWDVWSHKYNLYGLLAYYTTTGYQPALDACKKIGDLLCTTFGNNAGQKDIILAGEHVGMAATSVLDPMIELYKYTGEKKYLDFCYYIINAWEQKSGPKIISSLLATGRVNKVANGKAYEMLSNFVGLIKLYRLTGNKKFLNPVLIAWQDVVTNRLYVTGTTSSFEHFQEEHLLPASDKDNMGEGCVTTTWIQLNQNLLAITGELKYEEQIEKSIYNHLLSAENPETGCVSYYTPLMGKKPFSCDITCCLSSVPRGIAMIPYFTFGNINNVPTLMMYEPAFYKENIITTNKKSINLSVKVESDFPENSGAVITINTTETASFPFALRVPSWCNSFIATVGGKAYKGSANKSLIIERSWKSGEKIKVSFNMPVQILSGGKSYPGQIAFQRGPQILAFDESLNAGLLKIYPLGNEQKLSVSKPETKNHTDLLPNQWFGKQAYTLNIINKKDNAEKQQLVLVPYADASQTGGAVKVWMPLDINK